MAAEKQETAPSTAFFLNQGVELARMWHGRRVL
jgi:hypothetical protein